MSTISVFRGLPRSYLTGLTLSNNGVDATNDIDIAVGECRDSTNAKDLRLGSAITKRLDAAWTVGSGNGGLDTGTIANTTYHIWLILRSDTGVVDALFSTSASAPTMPTNYDYKRRIGSIVRTGAAIKLFTQLGDEFLLKVPLFDVSVSNLGTTATLYTLGSVPTGVKFIANILVECQKAASTPQILVTSPDQDDTDPSTIFTVFAPSSGVYGQMHVKLRTNTSSQVRARSTLASTLFDIVTYGWIDTRGRDD